MAAATDYAKKKNAELEELLKARGLPHTGKKAELVARLQEDDATADTAPAAEGEDVIDWDDAGEAAAAATTKPAADAVAAGGTGRVANPVAVPNQVATDEPATAEQSINPPAAEPPAVAPEPAEPAKDYAAGLATSTVTAELEKRKARAARFGLAGDAGDDDTAAADKELARAKRFGVDSSEDGGKAVSALDAALPDDQRRKRGRGPEIQAGGGGRDGKRRDSRRRDGRGGGGGGERVREGGVKKSGGGGPMTDADRHRVEARAKRFAAAS